MSYAIIRNAKYKRENLKGISIAIMKEEIKTILIKILIKKNPI